MIKKNRICFLCISALGLIALTGCATQYQPMGLTGGYTDMQLNKNTYKVSFRGNGFTSQERVRNFLLYRCAQLTNANNYRYFVILTGNENYKSDIYTTPTTINTYATGNVFGNGTASTNYYGYQSQTNYSLNGNTFTNSHTTIRPGQTYDIKKYIDTVIIKMLRNNKKFPNAFDAKILLSSLAGTIHK